MTFPNDLKHLSIHEIFKKLITTDRSNTPAGIMVVSNGVATAPSSYGAVKAAVTAPTTTVAVQAFATGTATLTMSNLSATTAEYCIVGMGESLLEAEANRDGTEAIVIRADSDLEKRRPANATHYAWKSASGTPSLFLGENA